MRSPSANMAFMDCVLAPSPQTHLPALLPSPLPYLLLHITPGEPRRGGNSTGGMDGLEHACTRQSRAPTTSGACSCYQNNIMDIFTKYHHGHIRG